MNLSSKLPFLTLAQQTQTLAEVPHFRLSCFPVCVYVLDGVMSDFSVVEAVIIPETVLILL